MYSYRARIGMLLPSTNAAAEPQIQAMLPPGVAFHTTRLKLIGSSEREAAEMVERLEESASLLAHAAVDLIVFHCTAVSMLRPGFDDEVVERITRATGIPATATSKAVVEAFRALGVRRIALTTPYDKATNAREIAFLRAHQIAVLSETGMDLHGGPAMLAVEPGEWYRRVRAQASAEADGYFISCTAIRAAEVIAPLEEDLGRPVLTSNQAMVWHALRTMGVRARIGGFGRLFETLAAA